LSIKFSRPIFLIFFLFAASQCISQNIKLGIKGGLSLPNLSSSGSSEVSKGYKTISGPDFGLVLDYTVADKVSIETGLEWSTQGGQKSGLQTIPASPELTQYFPPGSNVQFLYANFSSTVRLQYLMLPILLKYSIDLDAADHWKMYWDGGVFGGLLMTAKASASGSSKVYFDKEETQPVASIIVKFDSTGDIKNQLHKGNFGIEGNVGVLYHMNSMSVFAEGGANYGFINLQKSNQNGINHTGALIFRIGLFIDIKHKS
jgi:Outer membrane protein beta-barrel domain